MPQSADLLSFLASVTLRSLVLFLAAAAALLAFRIRSAAARHAVWTVVTAGMLTLAALSPLLPPVPVRILKAISATPVESPDIAIPIATSGPLIPIPVPARAFTWQDAALAVYILGAAILLARLAVSYLFTRRLLRAATPIPNRENLYSSNWISVPLTIGRRVLLPADWVTWDAPKLNAVLAHERTHVRRADWAIALMAGINRCLFWFHPLSWWLERRLAILAEQACDDSALLLVDSQPYAQALLDMSAAVRSAQGRLVWEAMAMANAAEVKTRIERILDESRQIPRAVTRARWAALLALSVPLIWLVSVTQLVPAAAQEQSPKTPAALAEFLKGRRQLTPGDVATMEQYLAANPHDLDVRSQVVLYYYANNVREPRMSHIFWLVANHPESTVAIFASQGVLPRDNALNTYAEFQRLLAAWRQAAAANQGNGQVTLNAARFLQLSNEFEEAEKLLLGAMGESRMGPVANQLAKLYAAAILGATGDPGFPNPSPSFAARVRNDLEASNDGFFLQLVAASIQSVVQRPQLNRPLPPAVLDVHDRPLLTPAVDLAERILNHALQLAPRSGVSGGVVGGIPGGIPNGVQGGISVSPFASSAGLGPAPPVLKSVAPVYPPLIRQARISGVVKLRVSVATNGTVSQAEVISGHPAMVPVTLEAVKQWVFQATDKPFLLEVPFSGLPGDERPAPATGFASATGLGPAPPVLKSVAPEYSALARQARISGTVKLRVTTSATDGSVTGLEVISGHPLLVPASLQAVRQWVFQTQPGGSAFLLDVPFTLPPGEERPAAVTPSEPQPAIPSRIKVGGNVQAARLIRHADPVYPAQARAERIEGTVTLQVTINQSGGVDRAEPIEGNPVLAAAAQEAVRQWAYQPTLLNGQPVSVETTVTVPFRLP